MAPWDEQVPGSPGNLPGTTPNAITLQALAQRLFGRPDPSVGMAPQSTAAVTPLASLPGAPGAGGPSTNMPPGVPGVPATNLPQGTGAPQSRPMPSPNAMLGGSFSYPNKSARNAAVVSTGVENISEAIHNFKVQKDQDEFQRAKNTWDFYQKAAAINPETGQPTDPHTMKLYAKDGKIVKSWEKMLKMQFPREAGPPDPKTGKPTQGPPIIPAPQAPAAAQVKELKDQRELAQLRGAPGETGGLTPAEAHQAALVEAGIKPKAQDQRAMDKIDAEIENLKAEKLKNDADIKRLDAETLRLGPDDLLRSQQINAEKALARERNAQADKDLKEATKSKSLQEFTIGRASIKDALTQSSKELSKMQSQAMAARGKIGKLWGGVPDPTPEEDAKQNEVSARHDTFVDYNNMQDDVTAQRMTSGEAMLKARRVNNLDSEFRMWGGVPDDAPQTPPKEWEDGHVLVKDGVDLAVKQGNKWVAP